VRISPIRIGYQPVLRFVKTSKSKKKSVSETKKQKAKALAEEGIFENSAVEIPGEDPDSAFDTWHRKLGDLEGGDSSQFFSELYGKATRIKTIFNDFPQVRRRFLMLPKQTIQHLTIPEAILIEKILKSQIKDVDQTYFLHPDAFSEKQRAFRFRLHRHDIKEKEIGITLHFFVEEKRETIFERKVAIGEVNYVVRNKQLEEVEGDLYSGPILLDPIWVAGKKITSERLVLGQWRGDLIRDKRQKSGLLSGGVDGGVGMSVKNILSKQLDVHAFLTQKIADIGGFRMTTRLIFLKYLMVPVGGTIRIEKITV
jgi:hypothetical protein